MKTKKKGVAESRDEFGCRDVAMQRLYKDFEITQNYFSSRNQQRQKKKLKNPIALTMKLSSKVEL
ncbi:MAG: hypothetical protein V7K97_29980 [Nostoc sp.]|uniref:hypothetical protein n=1 Tax=Nostoc sp. TaxID=1180 RepID=UPI002FF66060